MTEQVVYDMKSQPAADKYRGCGHAWVAINDGEIVDLRYMDDHVGDFLAWRVEARQALSEKGTVMSGMMSCREFTTTK